MLLSEVEDQVRFLTKEPFPNAPQFATNTRVTYYANKACEKLASLTKCYLSTNVPNSSSGNPSLSTVAGQYKYLVPTDCLEIVEMKISVWRIQRKTIDWINRQTGYQWWQISGQPSTYFMLKDDTTNFAVWPTPQSIYPISLWYLRRPTTLVNSTDVVDLDSRLDLALLYFICEQVMAARREQGFRAGYWMNLFYKEVQEYNNTADQSMAPTEAFGQIPVASD